MRFARQVFQQRSNNQRGQIIEFIMLQHNNENRFFRGLARGQLTNVELLDQN